MKMLNTYSSDGYNTELQTDFGGSRSSQHGDKIDDQHLQHEILASIQVFNGQCFPHVDIYKYIYTHTYSKLYTAGGSILFPVLENKKQCG